VKSTFGNAFSLQISPEIEELVRIFKYVGYTQRPSLPCSHYRRLHQLATGATMPPLCIVDGAFENMKILRRRTQQLRHAIMISIERVGVPG
jgi:hypothetical protein